MKATQEQTNGMKSGLLSYLWLIIGAILSLFANGNWIVPIATWLFPIFIIRFLRDQKRIWGIILCAIAFTVINILAWQDMIPLSGILYYVVTSGIGILLFLPFLADKIIATKFTGFLSTLVFPLAFTSVEYINSLLNPFGTWGSLAYTQYGNLPLMQVVSITGVSGLTFLITWFAPVVNWIWEQQLEWPRINKGVKIYVGVMAAVLLFGGMYLVFLSPKSNDIKVAGVQSHLYETVLHHPYLEWFDNGNISEANWESILAKAKIVNDDLFSKSELAAKSGARVVFWAETTAIISIQDEPAFIERAKGLAKQEQIYLGMALATVLHTDYTRLPENKMYENNVVIVGPTGDVLSEYHKTILVPGLEAEMGVKGNDDASIIDTPYGRISSLICYDNDFPSLTRRVGKAGADIFFDPSGDWEGIDPYHTNMKAFRAIENGFSYVRITRGGLSAAYDYQGRTLATMDYFKTEDKILTAHVPEKGVTTIYSHIGDLFAWFNIAGLITLSGLAQIRKRRSDIAR
jgi:apolipoprotein N-acyltransferase